MTSGFFWPMTLASVVIIYSRKKDVVGTIYFEHFEWLLYTFWVSIILLMINLVLSYIYIGYLGIIITITWVMYRLSSGFLCLLDDLSPYNN
ncbi:putative membrane protein [Candidatus Kinetoplastibacterium desouzaii TCC079E]|uniref:Putative membrane protein n=2 Tax=Candidatus Kinetoplastidibacterium desouzai TaxID=994692 RepID=M1L2Z8_9PROT|nr:putative membrane protein [Candidatus Kinetoplastibacterium desouzaii TCC079E]